ncbi:Kcnh2 [Symbiodinium natans]|uniref:Kcnh2 protein n=1 Tax=Symbiodinium natans TaxID=878477 RepID=A0A812ICX0_9DINO|nr:Kcnh2 [Symbiodinium natans]
MILKEPHGSNDQPPLDIDLMINRAILNEDDFACSACSWLFVRRLLRRGGLSSQEQGKVGLTPVAHIASKTAQQDGTSQPDVVSAGSHCSMNGRALQNWTQLILRASTDFKLAKRMQIPSDPALQLHPLWLTKQQTRQAGFAAASNLRLNISTALKTGDRRTDDSSCLQPYIMNPYGSKRLAWGVLGVVMILWDLVVIPLTVFELGQFEGAVDGMGYMTFCYWLLDLAGSFLVGSDMEGTLEMRPGPIASAQTGCKLR